MADYGTRTDREYHQKTEKEMDWKLNISRQALDFHVPRKRKIGTPVYTWRRTLRKELRNYNKTWNKIKKKARDRNL